MSSAQILLGLGVGCALCAVLSLLVGNWPAVALYVPLGAAFVGLGVWGSRASETEQ